nr:VanZ family protein [Alkalisalibacterium limincola]
MYFVLMAAAVQLFASPRALLGVAVALAAYGLLLEVAQHTLTTTRMFEWGDVLANTLGVVLGLGLAATPLARGLVWFEHRALRRGRMRG